MLKKEEDKKDKEDLCRRKKNDEQVKRGKKLRTVKEE